jgi:predicted metal-dependent enzyme (double-stranded beta helix superfamily)
MKMIVASLLALVFGLAQQAAVPVEQEPQHKVVFKNDYVRIIDATLPPGYVTLNHTHAADNVSVTISSARGIGRAGFAKGGYSHSVTNSGTGVMRFIVVEPLKTDHPNTPAADLPKHILETENDRVRIYRLKLAAGDSLTTHTHAAGWVEVTVAGGAGSGVSAWHGAGESHPLKVDASGAPLEIVELEPK